MYFTENDRWRTDEEFGRATLNGVNPVRIRRCARSLSKFPVKDADVRSFLDRGHSLEEEMAVKYVLLNYRLIYTCLCKDVHQIFHFQFSLFY